MSTYTEAELQALGFATIGKNLQISRKASFYGTERISISDNVRIDDFCILSAGEGGIEIGSHIHIGVNSSLIGAAKITLADYCNISSRVAIYSSNDDYSGEYMTNPMVPVKYTNVQHSEVTIGKHSIVGCGAVILPNVTIGEGCAVGALSLVTKSLSSWGVYVGIPAKYVKNRSKKLLTLEKLFEENNSRGLDSL